MSLQPYEKHVACILTAVFLALAVISFPKKGLSTLEKKEIRVQLVGAVQECTLVVPSGSTVDDVLRYAILLPTADLLEICGSRRLCADTILVVPFTDLLTLYVTGAVERSKVLVFSSTPSALEILKNVQPTGKANVPRFMRRRAFKTGMVVWVPEKACPKRTETD